jgi:hypothetical protein
MLTLRDVKNLQKIFASNDNENDESKISDDTLKNKCLTIKVTVQLEVLDITKLSIDVKSVTNPDTFLPSF